MTVEFEPWTDDNAERTGVVDGIRWEVRKHPIAGYNGYIVLPAGHPWFPHSSSFTDLWDVMQFDPCGPVTYADPATGRIGFDTGHSWDWWAPESWWNETAAERMHGHTRPMDTIETTLGQVVRAAERFARAAATITRGTTL